MGSDPDRSSLTRCVFTLGLTGRMVGFRGPSLSAPSRPHEVASACHRAHGAPCRRTKQAIFEPMKGDLPSVCRTRVKPRRFVFSADSQDRREKDSGTQWRLRRGDPRLRSLGQSGGSVSCHVSAMANRLRDRSRPSPNRHPALESPRFSTLNQIPTGGISRRTTGDDPGISASSSAASCEFLIHSNSVVWLPRNFEPPEYWARETGY
jgi:hypothetical protein